jgi:hypothetical protein
MATANTSFLCSRNTKLDPDLVLRGVKCGVAHTISVPDCCVLILVGNIEGSMTSCFSVHVRCVVLGAKQFCVDFFEFSRDDVPMSEGSLMLDVSVEVSNLAREISECGSIDRVREVFEDRDTLSRSCAVAESTDGALLPLTRSFAATVKPEV